MIFNKFLSTALLTLTILASGKANNQNVKTANADTSNEKIVEKGYISNNFVNENGYVDMTTNDNVEKITDYYTVNRAGDFTTVDWNTDIMDLIFANKTATNSEVFHKSSDEDNLLKVNGQTTSWWETPRGMYYTLFSQKVAVNMLFEDWDTSKEQPLEFVFALDDNLNYSPNGNLVDMLHFLGNYTDNDFSLPVLKIDGQTIIELNKTGDSFTFNHYNSRVYLGYGPVRTEDPNGYIMGNNGVFFVEIPFRNYIQTIETLQFQWWTDEEAYHCEGIDSYVNSTIWLDSNVASHSKFSPFNFSNLNFKKGELTAVSGTSPLRIKTTFGYITDYFKLDYIILSGDNVDSTIVYTKPTDVFAYGYGREQIYELYSDSGFTKKFNYNNDSVFIKYLKSSLEDIDFNISYYSYSIVFNSKDLSENLHDLLTDNLRPSGYNDKPLTSLDLEEILGFNPRTRKRGRFANSNNENESAIVDCGKYYAFSYKSEFQIHQVNFNSVQTHYFGLSRLFFQAEDITVGINVRYIQGIMFSYSYKEGSNSNKLYSLAIVSGDLPIDGKESGFLGLPEDKMIKKYDKFGTEFIFRSATDWETLGNLITGNNLPYAVIREKPVFVVCTSAEITYKQLYSVVYCNQAGDIINLSAMHDLFGEGYTPVINEDGSITIFDIERNPHPGYHFDEDTGVLKNQFGQNVDGADIKDDTDNKDDWWRKLLAIISMIAVVGASVWIVSKVGPTFAIMSSNKGRKNNKRRKK